MKKYFITKLATLSDNEDHLEAIKSLLKDEPELADADLDNQPNVTVYNQEGETLKIKTVRSIISDLSYSTYQGKKRFVILFHADKASIPAQNSLLKVVEEPPANTQIILTCGATTNILPTIISRCNFISAKDGKTKLNQKTTEKLKNAKEILAQVQDNSFSHADAIELAEKYKKREEAQELIAYLLEVYSKQLSSEKTPNKTMIKFGQSLLDIRKALQQNLNPALCLEQLFFGIIKNKKTT